MIKQPTPPPITGLNSRSLYSKSNPGANGGAGNLVLLSTKKKKKGFVGGGDGNGNGKNNNNGSDGNDGNVESNGGTGDGHSGTNPTSATMKLMQTLNIVEDEKRKHHLENGSSISTQDKSTAAAFTGGVTIAWGAMNPKKNKEKVQSMLPPSQPQQSQQLQPQLPMEEKIEKSLSKVESSIQVNEDTKKIHNPTSPSSSFLKMKKIVQSHPPNNTNNTNDSSSNNMAANKEGQTNQDQVEFMKKLAKEKAAKKRQEEEFRIKEQKERAALRLKELEMKMARKTTTAATNNHIFQRTLYDPSTGGHEINPSRTYSSLVGSTTAVSATPNNNGAQRQTLQSQQQQQHSNKRDQIPGSVLPPMTMIHLSSYDDRDRGMMRNANAGPRMLFDPKSGSMVAVPPKEESITNNHGNSDRDKVGGSSGNNKKKNKSKSSKKKDSSEGLNGKGYEDGMDGKDTKGNKKGKNKRDKKKDEKKGLNGSQERRRKNSTSSTSDKIGKQSNGNTQSVKIDRLPRTKGVLYKRDDKGNVISADGCEGDQGYGAHSVPGGRIRNPKAFESRKKKLQEESEKFTLVYQNFNDAIANKEYSNWHIQYNYDQGQSLHMEHDAISFKLNRSHFMRKKSPSNDYLEKKENEDEINIDVPSSLRVKGDDKLQLLTGIDDSPALKATAAAWAPSEAALALAAANANKAGKEKNEPESTKDQNETKEGNVHPDSLVDNNCIDEDDEDTDSIQYGLGFDPTKDMDSVMKSPAFPSGLNDNGNTPKVPELLFDTNNLGSKSIFGTDILLNSSPWGGKFASSESLGSLANWDYSLTTEKKDGDNEITPSEAAQPFLSLGGFNDNKSTWGSGGLISGFNETSFGSPSSKG